MVSITPVRPNKFILDHKHSTNTFAVTFLQSSYFFNNIGNTFLQLHFFVIKKDTGFNIGPNDVSSDIKVDPDEFPLQGTVDEYLKSTQDKIYRNQSET